MLELARSEYLDRRENVLALGNSGTGQDASRARVGAGRLSARLSGALHHRRRTFTGDGHGDNFSSSTRSFTGDGHDNFSSSAPLLQIADRLGDILGKLHGSGVNVVRLSPYSAR